MVYRRVIKWPKSSLNVSSREVDLEKDSQIIADLLDTFKVIGGYGLSAPQIGANVKVIVINEKLLNKDEASSDTLLMVNPKVLEKKGTETFKEACFSLPGISLDVLRSKEVMVEWLDSEGNKKSKWFKNYSSACVQHEIDHLNGILTIDKLSQLRKSRLIKKIKKAKSEDFSVESSTKEEMSKIKSLRTRKKKRSIRKAKKK